MKRALEWILSGKHWLILVACSVPVLLWLSWLLLTFRTATLVFFATVWVVHLALGFGAGYAALRLWYFRHHPLIKWVGIYITAFIVDVVSAIVLLFVAKGVRLTWTFSAVMFISTLISNFFRAPLIFYLIRGPEALPLPAETQNSGEKPPEFWLEAFRQIVREEVARERQRKAGQKPTIKPPRKVNRS